MFYFPNQYKIFSSNFFNKKSIDKLFCNANFFCSSGNRIPAFLGPSLYRECSTCLGTTQARESERLLMSAQKHKAGQWIWCKWLEGVGWAEPVGGGVPLAAASQPPKRSTKRGRTAFSFLLENLEPAPATASAAALSQTKAGRDAKAFRGKHVGKVLQVLQISLAALACGWP